MYSQELLGLLVARGLAVASAVLLVSLGGFVGRSSSDELVRESRLVLMALCVGDLKAREHNEHTLCGRAGDCTYLLVGTVLIGVVREPTHGVCSE